VGYQLVGVN